jgi:hypothetical protein
MAKPTFLVFALLLSMPTMSFAGWFGPNSYDECILESMKGVTSDVAARMIASSCRKKFPDKPKVQPKSRELDFFELFQLTGRAGKSFGSHFGGNIYNGNSSVTISRITVVVTTRIGKKNVPRTYVADVRIPPQTTRDFCFRIVEGDEGANYSWGIIGALGY